jgi:hypothetical protein
MIMGQTGNALDPFERASFWMAWISSMTVSSVAAIA